MKIASRKQMKQQAVKSSHLRVFIVCTAFLSLVMFVSGLSGQTISDTTTMSESEIRNFALRIVMPEYPVEAVRARQTGVAVASLTIGTDGRVSQLNVLEAPSDSIKAAVSKAVLQWRFSPAYIGGTSVKVEGKLTFYFAIERDKGVVLNPNSAGYRGKQNEYNARSSRK